jgi:2-amino-4-hydroxy-6-hydroxymethyldihydropteridine diphosphokinase
VKSPQPSRKRPATTTRTPTKKRSSSSTARARKKRKTTDRRVKSRTAYLGLGSNVGNRRAHLEEALREIDRVAPLRRVSSFYRTEPVGFADQRDFWNAVVEIAWRGSASELLEAARRVESRVGRTATFENGPREIDVDVLDLAGLVRERGDPILPHPRLTERRFALAPLAEIAPDWKDPRSGRGVRELLDEIPETPRVRRVARSSLRGPGPGA